MGEFYNVEKNHYAGGFWLINVKTYKWKNPGQLLLNAIGNISFILSHTLVWFIFLFSPLNAFVWQGTIKLVQRILFYFFPFFFKMQWKPVDIITVRHT